jgi:hypothetical protein
VVSPERTCVRSHIFLKLKVIPLCGKFPLAFGRSRSRNLKDVFSYSLNERWWAENAIPIQSTKGAIPFHCSPAIPLVLFLGDLKCFICMEVHRVTDRYLLPSTALRSTQFWNCSRASSPHTFGIRLPRAH